MAGFKNAVRLPSAKFNEVGDTVEGIVIGIEEVPVPAFNAKGRPTGANATDEEGNPIMQNDVTVETAGGKVVIHCKPAITYAIGRSLGEIGAEDLDEGDSLSVTYTGDGESSAKGRNAPKQYSATIVKA